MEKVIYHLERNKIPFYVGKTSNIKKRFTAHKKKYGNNISIVVIEEVNDKDWKELERYHIETYFLQGHKLLNTHSGGNGRPEGIRNTKFIIDAFMNDLNSFRINKIQYNVYPDFIEQLSKYYNSFNDKEEAYIRCYERLFNIYYQKGEN